MEESVAPKFHQEGETVEGTIVAIGPEVAFINIGGKGEATIDLEELADPDREKPLGVGDKIKAVIVSVAGGLKLSFKLAQGAATRQRLVEAFQAGLPVEGRVEKPIKGGYEIRIGGQRAFCPISQIDAEFTADAAVHVGLTYTFRITECKDDGKDLVVSRRVLLQEEQEKRAEKVRQAAVPGATLSGRVASVVPYGAFVDLGGVQGLLHVSEMGWSRVEKPADVVNPGDPITVRVLRVDDKGKISLSLKQLQADPWSSVEEKYRVGQKLKGKITRVADFGAFLELEPGIEALAHASTFAATGKRNEWKASVQPGATVALEILSIEPDRRRIGVAVKESEELEAPEPMQASDPAAEGFGSIADKLRAAIEGKKKS